MAEPAPEHSAKLEALEIFAVQWTSEGASFGGTVGGLPFDTLAVMGVDPKSGD